MVLNLKDLFAGGKNLEFDYELDLSGLEIAPGEFPFREPVRVKGGVYNHAGVITLTAEGKCRYFTRCDRCLADIVEEIRVPVSNVLVTALAGEDVDESIVVCENETLDLDDLVQTDILLSLPMKHLCSEDCRGLCPVCGKNLNEGDCGCARDNEDSPFSQLRKLIE